MYEYVCSLARLVDGDTAYLIVDLGFNIRMKECFRLFGIDTPEVRGVEKEAGKAATAHLQKLIDDGLAAGGKLIARTRKDKKGKYGRWICTLLILNPDGSELDLNNQLVKDGHAIEKDY